MERTPLYGIERRSGATFTRLFDWEIADSFGDLASEYRATHESVAVLDRSYVGPVSYTHLTLPTNREV